MLGEACLEKRVDAAGINGGFNRALRQWDRPCDGTTYRLGTCVPSGHGVLSGGFLGPCQVVVSGALRAPKG